MKPVLTLIALVIGTFAAIAAPASAAVQPAGTGEPAFTRSTQNTQWFEWSAPGGIDDYRVTYSYYRDDVLVTTVTQNNAQLTSGGWADWAGIATLEEGRKYAICAQGAYSFPNDSLYFSDGPNSCSMGVALQRRAYTIIDRTAPSISVSLAGGAATTKSATVGLHIDFQDANAGPFPANFICVKAGADPATGCTLSYAPACSVAANSSKNTTFDCQVDASALPDGPIGVCVKSADGAIPDVPGNSNQSGSATSANISAQQCDTIVLDRAAPSVTAGASKVSALTGEAIDFTAQANDAASGVSGAATWKWADGTTDGAGNSASHSFAQAGTYVVQARVADAAGNVGVGEITVTVSAPPANPAPADPGTSDPEPTNPGPTDPGTSDPSPSDPVSPSPTPNPSQPSAADKLTLLVTKKFVLKKKRRPLAVDLTTRRSGRLLLRLVRRGQVVARLQTSVRSGLSAKRLRLPRKLRAGTYALEYSFLPANAADPITGRKKVKFVKGSCATGGRPGCHRPAPVARTD